MRLATLSRHELATLNRGYKYELPSCKSPVSEGRKASSGKLLWEVEESPKVGLHYGQI